jgi:hypothetical protein
LQDQLPGVGVLAFVALERRRRVPQSDVHRERDNRNDEQEERGATDWTRVSDGGGSIERNPRLGRTSPARRWRSGPS